MNVVLKVCYKQTDCARLQCPTGVGGMSASCTVPGAMKKREPPESQSVTLIALNGVMTSHRNGFSIDEVAVAEF